MPAKTQVNSKMLLSAIKQHPLYKQVKGRSKMKKAELIKAINKLINNQSRKVSRQQSRKVSRQQSRKVNRKPSRKVSSKSKVNPIVIAYLQKLTKEKNNQDTLYMSKTKTITEAEHKLRNALNVQNPSIRVKQDIEYNTSLIKDATKSRDIIQIKLDELVQKIEDIKHINTVLQQNTISLNVLQKTKRSISKLPDSVKKVLMHELRTHS